MSKVTSKADSADTDTKDYESEVYNHAISALANLLPSINTVDSTTQNSIDSEINAYKQSGVDELNDEYNSDLSDLQDDSATRFGNLDNSMFMSGLSNLQNERAKSTSDLENTVESKEYDLLSNALSQNYSYADLLTDIINDYYDNTDSLASAYSKLSSSNNSSALSALSSGSSSKSLSSSDIKNIIASLSLLS